jgi:hypothetical protein
MDEYFGPGYSDLRAVATLANLMYAGLIEQADWDTEFLVILYRVEGE